MTKNVIYDCSEYDRNFIFTDLDQSPNIQDHYSVISYGLCKHCDFENNCSLNKLGTVVFNCEQYQ